MPPSRRPSDILKKLKAGANFADLAKKESDDPSKENGGELGWIGRGRIPDIEDQIFALNKGQTSDVLKSALGFNIVRVEDKRTAHVQSLDEVKVAIEPHAAPGEGGARHGYAGQRRSARWPVPLGWKPPRQNTV